jgi:SlyX protein
MNDTITDLQIRLTDQDDALQALTRTVARQQNQIDQLRSQLEQLSATVRELGASQVAAPGSEPPPPHY